MISKESLNTNNAVLHWTGDKAVTLTQKTVTTGGNTTQLLPFARAGFAKFDGNGDYLTIPDSDAWSMFGSSNNFTIEGWIYYTSIAANRPIISQYVDASNYWNLTWTTSNVISLIGVSGGTTNFNYSCSFTPVISTLYHVAVVKSGSTCYIFINGFSQSVTVTQAFQNTTNIASTLDIGRYAGTPTYMYGNIYEFRISSIARYTSNFNVPKRQLNSDNHTTLLLHFNSTGTTFTDYSPLSNAITANGDVKSITSPGGSGISYFDGNGDYLQLADSDDWTFTGDFSFEYWAYHISLAADNTIIVAAADSTTFFRILHKSTGITLTYGSSISYESTYALTTNDWHFYQIVRSAGIIYLYRDTSLIGQTSYSGTIDPTNGWYIGREYNSATVSNMNGYISDLKISNVARTIATPSIPLATDSNTKLLLHMNGDNGSFYDSSKSSDVSGFTIVPDGLAITPTGTFTSQTLKNGHTTYLFDGSTNYITLGDHPDWSMFTKNFTIATWIKFTDISANRYILGQFVDTNNYWYLKWTTSNTIVLEGKTSSTTRFSYNCPLTPVAGTWYHLVVERSGSSCLMYIDKVSQTVTESTAWSATATDIASTLNIGSANSEFMQGNIKDLMIFKENALSTDKINALYNETFIY